ncbi:MAG: hypothetical protein SWO11_13855 [Thermodesulfobacteriota bacterium]|nr:hypothetical protein [Thermodesulfobacteriota bacterium]
MKVRVAKDEKQEDKTFPDVEIVLSIRHSLSQQSMEKFYYNVFVSETEDGINWRTAIGMVEISLENVIEGDPSIIQLDLSQNVYLLNCREKRKLEDDIFILKDKNGRIHLLTRVIRGRTRLILKNIQRNLMQKIRLDIF